MLNRFQCNIIFIHIIITKATHIERNSNNSDTFITYAGHSEVKDNIPIFIQKPESGTGQEKTNYLIPDSNKPETKSVHKDTKDVVFVPNDKPIERLNDEYSDSAVKISDVINGRKNNIHDIIRDGDLVTKAPFPEAKDEIIFITGKNKENRFDTEKIVGKTKQDSYKKTMKNGSDFKRMNCSHLECNNTIDSICGGKLDSKEWKYRLFLNDCFYRKVNCAFKYPNNRYKVVSMDKCNDIASHSNAKPPQFLPDALPLVAVKEETRRSFSSRRSLNIDSSGLRCSHRCPVVCTDSYEPTCATARSGEYKTFLNHCKLDYDSCLHRVEWRIRPLAECVGGRKADMRQNRGFIAWMQKVGIVDNKGRLDLKFKKET